MKNENERFVEMGKRIKARRVSLGMKQMELAERIDISPTIIFHPSREELNVPVLNLLSGYVMYWM